MAALAMACRPPPQRGRGGHCGRTRASHE
jgi:hypothetical protein